jgi:hypothetical protein
VLCYFFHQCSELKHETLGYGDRNGKFEPCVSYWLTSQSYRGIGRRARHITEYGLHEALSLLAAGGCISLNLVLGWIVDCHEKK